ncbi:hypothetical protein [Gemmobacter caeruleus]|uniref:hypothetical protein n=1 Tax=Gemmobacter caeruleus TaxID=2595004 RepID=UPI001396B7FC|nr:hypothetical protein [Gemmobacter caeruleus]
MLILGLAGFSPACSRAPGPGFAAGAKIFSVRWMLFFLVTAVSPFLDRLEKKEKNGAS